MIFLHAAKALMFTVDDTNICAIGCSVAKNQEDPTALSEWLNANKLVLNHNKKYQVKIN